MPFGFDLAHRLLSSSHFWDVHVLGSKDSPGSGTSEALGQEVDQRWGTDRQSGVKVSWIYSHNQGENQIWGPEDNASQASSILIAYTT